MENINQILARAAALRDETALNSITPNRAGGIMYDTLIALNDLWLQQGAALVLSKIYSSVSAMEADTSPVSDLTGQPLRPGQIVVIVASGVDNGAVYRYNGTGSPSWSRVGTIGNLPVVDNLDSDSSTDPLSAKQGKVLDGKVNQLDQDVNNIIGTFEKQNVAAYANIQYPYTIKAGARIYNYGVHIICASNSSLANRTDIPSGQYADLNADVSYIQTGPDAGYVSFKVVNYEFVNLESKVDKNYINLFNPNDADVAIGKYVNSVGALSTGESYNASGYIPVEENTLYCAAIEGYFFRYVNFYDKLKTHIASSQIQQKRSFTTPIGCRYVRITFYKADYKNAQVSKSEFYHYAPYSIIGGYLFTELITEKIPLKKIGKNKLDKNNIEATIGRYINTSGAISSNPNYCITPFIPLSEGKMIASIDGVAITEGSVGICYYDSELNYLSGHTITSTNGVATWYDGVSFVRFSIPAPTLDKAQVEDGENATAFETYGYFIPKEDILQPQVFPVLDSQRGSAVLSNGEIIELPLIYCRVAQFLSAMIDGEISGTDSVRVGRGRDVYLGFYADITATEVVYANVHYTHGLTLTDRTFFCISTDEKYNGKIMLVTSSGQVWQQDIITSLGGAAYAVNNTSNDISIELSLEFKKIESLCWFFGDSYFSLGENRWMYWVVEWGYKNFLADNLPGGNATQMLDSLKNLIKLGAPKYIVWCLGMNSGTDNNGNVNSAWMAATNALIAICESRGINLVFGTIPSVPNQPHEALNNWVRNSGYRYIDFAKAVNAQPDGTWDAGLLSSDNVHPTEAGAKVLATRAILDFPEMTLD